MDCWKRKSTHSVIEFASGDIGIYTSLWNAPGPWSVTISTPTKHLEMRPIEYLSRTYPSRQITHSKLSEVDRRFKPVYSARCRNSEGSEKRK